MPHRLQTAPTDEPLTLAQVKAHLRVVSAAEDGLLGEYLAAARQACEEYTRRAFLTQTWKLTLDRWPGSCGDDYPVTRAGQRFAGREIVLPRPPLQSVTAVTYIDEDGATQTLASSAYTVDAQDLYGRIVLKTDQSWPALSDVPNAVSIVYVAGYGAETTALPQTLTMAVRYLTAHLWKNREPINIGNIVNEIPFTFRAMLDVNRVPDLPA